MIKYFSLLLYELLTLFPHHTSILLWFSCHNSKFDNWFLQQQTDLDSSFKQEDDHISILYSRQQQTEARLEILERLHDQQAEPQTQRDSQKKVHKIIKLYDVVSYARLWK